MTDVLFGLQQAVMTALAANEAVPEVYDHVPQDAAFPYVVWGPMHVAAEDSKTDTGFETTVTLNIWSRYRGGKETRAIFQALYDALHRTTLTVSGQAFVTASFLSADFSLDEDGLTYFAAVRFMFETQDN
ncbi:MAG: DUF3168 domain-containing protein [Alphaproteobacteria bacterium]|nr:DUF3168 domain-containing protein [Alphaproteobacteria bacterium]